MLAYPISRLPSRSARQRFLFDFASIRGRSVASSRITVRRTAVHLLVRLAIAATCTSSAAAFDAAHISRMTVATVDGRHSLELRRHEARPNPSQSVPAVMEAPSFLSKTPCVGSAANSRPSRFRPADARWLQSNRQASGRRSSTGFTNRTETPNDDTENR